MPVHVHVEARAQHRESIIFNLIALRQGPLLNWKLVLFTRSALASGYLHLLQREWSYPFSQLTSPFLLLNSYYLLNKIYLFCNEIFYLLRCSFITSFFYPFFYFILLLILLFVLNFMICFYIFHHFYDH